MLKIDYAKNLTHPESIKKALENRYDVCKTVSTEMSVYYDRNSYTVLRLYADANERERAIMDALLLNLCGWSMNSIIDIAEAGGVIED